MRLCKGQYELGWGEAIKFNEMVRFGDRTVGTVPPLELRLEVEEVGDRVRPDTATVLIKSTQLLAAGQPLEDQVERKIAFLLFRYGRWNIETPAEIDATGRITSIAVLAAPPPEAQKEVERQGFAFVGALSSMYSAMFNEITLDDEGAVRQLDHHSDPGELGSLIPADYFEGPDRQLKLWVFQLQSAAQNDEASE